MIDTHVHLLSPPLWNDRKEILRRCTFANVHSLVNICLSLDEVQRIGELSGDKISIFHSAAIHPTDDRFDERYFKEIALLAQNGQLIAIGETGLDYVRTKLPAKAQADRFLQHMKLALKAHLPLIIHCRGAFGDLIEQLNEHYLPDTRALPGLIHCFSEGPDELALLVGMGWFVGFGGLTTYAKAVDVQKAVAKAPNHSFVLETDSPYLTPEPRRKERNEPSFIPLIAQHLAALRGQSPEKIIEMSTSNAKRLFFSAKIGL